MIRWDLQENKTGESFMMPCYAAILPKLTRSKGIRISMFNWKFSDWRGKVTKLLQLIRTQDLIWFCSLHSVSEALELYWSQRSECKYRCWRDKWLPDERKPGSQKLDDHMKERTGPFLSEKYDNVIPYNLVLLWNKRHSKNSAVTTKMNSPSPQMTSFVRVICSGSTSTARLKIPEVFSTDKHNRCTYEPSYSRIEAWLLLACWS